MEHAIEVSGIAALNAVSELDAAHIGDHVTVVQPRAVGLLLPAMERDLHPIGHDVRESARGIGHARLVAAWLVGEVDLDGGSRSPKQVTERGEQ